MRQMKDSGIEWIGQIPEEWEVRKLKTLATDKNSLFMDGDWIESDVIENSGIRYLTTGNIGSFLFKEQSCGYISKISFKNLKCMPVYPNDLAISRLNEPLGRACFIPDGEDIYVVAVDIVILRPNNNISKRFLLYCMNIENYNFYVKLHSRGTTMPRVSRTILGNMTIPLPTHPEQQRIADYLDAQCARIDETMELVRQSKEKLRAYKLSLITEAVTKGLDPDVAMKDSGIPWIGEIPAGWKIVKLKFFTSIKSGDAIRADELSETAQYEVFGGNGKIGNCVSYNCDGPSFIIGRVGAQCGNIHKTHNKIFVSDNALILKIFENKFDFIFFSLISANLGRLSTSNAQPLITATKISNTYIPVPPLPEQQRIAAYLDEKCARIDALLAEKDELLDKLAEYKKSLIFECVTGKREVAA